MKMWFIYPMECSSAIKKKEIMPFAATWMDLEIVILSQVSQTKINMIVLTCIILKRGTDKLIYETELVLWM